MVLSRAISSAVAYGDFGDGFWTMAKGIGGTAPAGVPPPWLAVLGSYVALKFESIRLRGNGLRWALGVHRILLLGRVGGLYRI